MMLGLKLEADAATPSVAGEHASYSEPGPPRAAWLARFDAGAPTREAAWGGQPGLDRGSFDPASWADTLLCWEARALDRFLLPWAAVSLFAVAWTTLAELTHLQSKDLGDFSNAYALVLTTVIVSRVFLHS